MYMYHDAWFRKCKIQNVIYCTFLLAFYVTPKIIYIHFKTQTCTELLPPDLTLKIILVALTIHCIQCIINGINGNFLFFLWFYSLVPALTAPEEWNYTFKKLTLQGRYSYMSNLKQQGPSWEANSSSATHFQLYHHLYQSHEVQLLYVVHKKQNVGQKFWSRDHLLDKGTDGTLKYTIKKDTGVSTALIWFRTRYVCVCVCVLCVYMHACKYV